MKKLSASIVASALTAAALSVPVCAASADAAPLLIFGRGVYAAWKNGKIITYYVFSDGSSGRTADARLGIGVEFVCEQTEDTVVFRMANSDKNVVMRCDRDQYGYTVGTFDDTGEAYTFIWVENSDPDNFDIVHKENGYFSFDGGVWEMKNAGEELMTAESASGAAAGILLDYVTAMRYGFDLTFTFTLDDGSSVERSMAYDGNLDSSGLFVGVRELLDDTDVKADKVAELTVTDNSGGSMESVSLGTSAEDRVIVRLDDTDAPGSTAYDEQYDDVVGEPDDALPTGAPADSEEEADTAEPPENSEGAPAEALPEEDDTGGESTAADENAAENNAAENADNTNEQGGGEASDEDCESPEKPDIVLKLPDGSVVVSLPSSDRNPVTGADNTAALAGAAAAAAVILAAGKRKRR